MEDFVFYNGKKLRKGYTTGSCATAAAMAAALALFKDQLEETIQITLPSGDPLKIPIASLEPGVDNCRAFVVKDGGDDADATDGLLIGVEIKAASDGEIHIDGGEGVGRVTAVGLRMPVGEAAINPTPRKMIAEAVRKVIGPEQGAEVTVFVPKGAETAKLTMNSRLGIIGGISILGTSGIVTPMSEEGWKQAISIELEMKQKQGYTSIVLCPGNYGEDFAIKEMGLSPDKIVEMSNFIGYVLKEAQRLAFEKILMVGHLGKLIKVASGIFATHSKDSDARNETMIANLALLGAPVGMLQEIDECLTTEAAGDIVEREGYQAVYQVLADKIKKRSELYLKYRQPVPVIDVVIFSSQRGYLASTKPLAELEEEWR